MADCCRLYSTVERLAASGERRLPPCSGHPVAQNAIIFLVFLTCYSFAQESLRYPYKKGDGDKSRLCYLDHALMENRNGLVVDATTTLASGTAERDAALIMAGRSIKKVGATLGADKGYDAAEFVKQLRDQGVTPHVAQKKHSAIDGRTTRHAGYTVSIKKRKLVEEIFGWSKTIGGLRKARFVGLAKVRAQTTFTFAAYNLTRMATIFGWRLSTVVG